MAQSNLVNIYCHTSNVSKLKVLSALTEDCSMTRNIMYLSTRFKEYQKPALLSSMMTLIISLNTQLLINSKVQAKSFTLFVQMVILTKLFKFLGLVSSLIFCTIFISLLLRLAQWLKQSLWILTAIIHLDYAGLYDCYSK